MPTVEEAVQKQADNIAIRTGRPFEEWVELVRASGKAKHGEIVTWLKAEHGFGHGDANLVALTALRGPAAPQGDDLVDAIYAGPKAALRPFHDRVIEVARGFGGDVELAPKQSYVSLRRAKQFGSVGPARAGVSRSGSTSRVSSRRVASRPRPACARTASGCPTRPSSMPRWSAGCARPMTAPERVRFPAGR